LVALSRRLIYLTYLLSFETFTLFVIDLFALLLFKYFFHLMTVGSFVTSQSVFVVILIIWLVWLIKWDCCANANEIVDIFLMLGECRDSYCRAALYRQRLYRKTNDSMCCVYGSSKSIHQFRFVFSFIQKIIHKREVSTLTCIYVRKITIYVYIKENSVFCMHEREDSASIG